MNTRLPSGNIAFLFTDIEGSTQLAQRYPNEMPHLLARHDEILNRAIEARNGSVFQTAGDSFCVAFQTADDSKMISSTSTMFLSPKRGSG